MDKNSSFMSGFSDAWSPDRPRDKIAIPHFI